MNSPQLVVPAGHFAAIIEHSDDAIISKTLQGIITSWNKGAERLYGYTADEIVGKPIALLIPAGMPDEEPGILARIQRGELIDHYETIRVTKDGRHVDISVTISPIKDDNGKIVGASKIARDIGEKKRNEAALAEALKQATAAQEAAQRAKEAADLANRSKSDFVTNMSHELRTPMNAIIGIAGLLERAKDFGARERQLIRTLAVSSESLLALINDLLDVSKMESGTMKMESIPFQFSELMPQIVGIIQLKAKEKGLFLRMESDEVEGRTYLGDPARLRQVLLNLCGNAIKFTEHGSISVHVGVEPRKDGGESVVISVTDTGIGIAADKHEAIFEKFVQADTSISRKYGGTGLGLAISRILTEAMGGTLTVESALAEGSTFCLTLPLPLASAPSRAPAAPPETPKGEGRVLLVEDYAPGAYVTATFLELEGYQVDIVESGEEALDRAGKSRYAAILMDVQMPGIDGYTATRAIRDCEAKRGLPASTIIGLTAHGSPADREKCLAAGMNDYVSKPFDAALLKRKLLSLQPVGTT